jgi:DNA helicase-2/ATP-dependent DNA helicase PcrA
VQSPRSDASAGPLSGLTASQAAAVTTEAAPLCIVAAAGAGKTRVLTRRIAYQAEAGRIDPRHTMALTFTRKAAGELQSRLHQLGLRSQVAAGTFHAMASAQLHRFWADRGQTPPTLLERKSRLLAPLAAARPNLAGVPISELAAHIEWAKARLIPAEEFEAAVRESRRPLPPRVAARDIAGLYARYEDEKVRRGLLDFDDLLGQAATAIEQDRSFAGAQRWRWRHLFVDEFQDVNPLQHRLLLAWLGPSTDLCVVGDPHQAVYGWNGADPQLLLQFPTRWPNAEVVHLDDNHRCSPQIVASAAAVLGDPGDHLRSAGPDGSPPHIRTYPSEGAEAAGVASGARQAHAGGRPWRSMAVLARTNAQLVPIQQALEAAGIPTWAPSQQALLDEPAARQLLSDLRTRPRVPLQMVCGDLGAARDETGSDEDAATLTALADLARAYQRQEPDAVVAQWLAWLPSALADDHRGSGPRDAVTLCSFHRSKGLEWDAVWIVGIEQGLVPIGRSTSDAAIAEERRLLYVALTRASVELHCSWARERTFGSRAVPREASPWLELIRTAVPPPGEGPVDAAAWRERLRQQRDQLRRARPAGRGGPGRIRMPPGWPDPDPELVAALQAWRAETARAAGLPAYSVLHDVTLAAVASLRPRDTQALLTVPGLGPVKAGRYGPTLLSLVADRAATG